MLVLTLFGWVGVCRIARSAVLKSKNTEFNTASTTLGSHACRNLFRHIRELPGPIIVIATTSLTSYIVAEAA